MPLIHKIKNLYTYSNNYNALAAPRYYLFGERCVDQMIENLEIKTSKKSP